MTADSIFMMVMQQLARSIPAVDIKTAVCSRDKARIIVRHGKGTTEILIDQHNDVTKKEAYEYDDLI